MKVRARVRAMAKVQGFIEIYCIYVLAVSFLQLLVISDWMLIPIVLWVAWKQILQDIDRAFFLAQKLIDDVTWVINVKVNQIYHGYRCWRLLNLYWLILLFVLQCILHFFLPSLLYWEIYLHAYFLISWGVIETLWIIQVVFVMQDHGVYKVYWVVENIALNHLAFLSFFVFGVLMMIGLIHGLIVMLLCPTSFIYDNCFLLSWWLYLTFILYWWLMFLSMID